MLHARLHGFVEAELTAHTGQTIAVVGPNGAGKTSLLRALAGLPSPSRATMRIGDRDVSDAPAHRRLVGYVPQEGALFPHLTALGNVAYGPRARGHRRRAAERAARDWLAELAAGELASRKPGELSGGQAQRVALARALATKPQVLLLDEPLAALDTAARNAVRQALRGHLRAYEGICLVVTHDPVDAVALADRMIVVEGGRITQDSTPAAITAGPRSAWVARMLGRNAYHGTSTETGIALERDPGLDVAGTAAPTAIVAADPLPPGHPALATIAPDSVALYRKCPEGSPRNAWNATVAEIVPVGSRMRVSVTGISGPDIIAEITPSALAGLDLAEGTEVWVSVKATEVAISPI